MMRIIIAIFCFSTFQAIGQNIPNAKQHIQTLTSPEFWGRGYTNNGMYKAADYLAAEFKKMGVTPLFKKSYFQNFSYPVNTFPGKLKLVINGVELVPGKDFLISPDSKGANVTTSLDQIDSTHYANQSNRIIVELHDKLTWSVATEVKDFTTIQLNKKSVKEPPAQISLQFNNKFLSQFNSKNVCGVIPGSVKSDSIIIISAHYDHLGGLGTQTYFPGANDNASGTALLLALADYYIKNKPRYSVFFLCFAGEEAGLLGSKYFVDHSPIELSKIRFLINLDLVGTGEEGVTVVNASLFKKEFSLLNEINAQKNYLTKIKLRGKAANSDHYWFTEKGVPSFFIYAMGGIQAYHDINDRSETLPLSEFADLYQLIIDFNNYLMR